MATLASALRRHGVATAFAAGFSRYFHYRWDATTEVVAVRCGAFLELTEDTIDGSMQFY